MLEHDYIQMLIEEFTRALVPALRRAFSDGDTTATGDLEAAASELLGFSPEAALALSPESLVSFAQLSNVSDSVAAYAAYALDRAADAHALAGDEATAEARHEQAQALAGAFGWSLDWVPEDLADVDEELFG